jgi:hypothetical protein
VFWKDYYNFNLGLEGTPNGIAALVSAHEKYAAGPASVLHLEDDLYIVQRGGFGSQPGLIYVLNNRGDRWNGAWVNTQWQNTSFEPVAWWSKTDRNRPGNQGTGTDHRGQFFAAPRGTPSMPQNNVIASPLKGAKQPPPTHEPPPRPPDLLSSSGSGRTGPTPTWNLPDPYPGPRLTLLPHADPHRIPVGCVGQL